jgi:hypothetical protein
MRALRRLIAASLIPLLAACQATSIQSAWFDSTYVGGPFAKIVVIAGEGSASDSRAFEDIMVQKLVAAGTAAIPGYATVPPEARATQDAFAAAVARTGADGVLTMRLLSVEEDDAQGTTIMMPGYSGGFYGGGFAGGGFYGGGAGGGTNAARAVAQTPVAAIEASLYSARTRTLVWSATTQTIDAKTAAKVAPGYADLLIGRLRARGLIAPAAR